MCCVSSCAAAYVLLAEEEATTITEAERLFKKALTIGECLSCVSQSLVARRAAVASREAEGRKSLPTAPFAWRKEEDAALAISLYFRHIASLSCCFLTLP